MEIDFQKIIKQIHDTGMQWIDAKLKVDQLEEDSQSFLSAIMNQLDDGTKSEAKLKRMASGSKEYRKFIADLCCARAEMLRLKVKHESAIAWLDCKRSELAFEREKLAKGIFHEGK